MSEAIRLAMESLMDEIRLREEALSSLAKLAPGWVDRSSMPVVNQASPAPKEEDEPRKTRKKKKIKITVRGDGKYEQTSNAELLAAAGRMEGEFRPQMRTG